MNVLRGKWWYRMCFILVVRGYVVVGFGEEDEV